MPATTPSPWLIPYPLGNDPLRDGDNAMQALAERVAALLAQSLGNTPITYTAGINGAGWGGTVQSAMRSGWVHTTFNLSKASWAAGEIAGTAPVGMRPNTGFYTTGMIANTAAPMMFTIDSTGQIKPVLASPASPGGIAGYVVYPLP